MAQRKNEATPVFAPGRRVHLQDGVVPLYHQVYEHLRGALDDGRLAPGDRLPGERELCDFYGCSMVTVRRALDELVREHRLERTRGRGTFVTPPPVERELQLVGSFTTEMRQQGLTPTTKTLAAREEGATPAAAGALSLEPGETTYVIERLRLVEDEPLLIEEVHLPAARFPGLLDADLERESLYGLLESRYDTRLDRASEAIQAIALGTREARLLGQARGRPALLLEFVGFDQRGRAAEYCLSTVRSDRGRYRVRGRS